MARSRHCTTEEWKVGSSWALSPWEGGGDEVEEGEREGEREKGRQKGREKVREKGRKKEREKRREKEREKRREKVVVRVLKLHCS